MAEIGQRPVASTPARAVRALEADLPKVLGGKSLVDEGWTRLDSLTLLVPLWGRRQDIEDDYYLRMRFSHYPDWPPSAQFVNPTSLAYRFPEDQHWLPRIQGTNEIAIHPNYQFEGRACQLICCSVTLEFYEVRHAVKPEHLWNAEHQNFAATLNAIKRVLGPPFYAGRLAQ